MSEQFKERRIPGLFYSADNLRCEAGHAAVFSSRPTRGLTIYRYNRLMEGWALHRVWSIGFVALHHVSEGKSTDPVGWHLTFARLSFKREYRGFSVRWGWADTSRVRPVR